MTITTEKIILNEARNVSLVAMVQTVGGEWQFGKRPGILVLPGGGYIACSDREAEVVAYPYLAAGFQVFVLRYSVGEHRAWPNPLDDYEQAMEHIRGHAEDYHLIPDKIAVVGFSAGGHLAGCAATLAKNRPNAALLIYAALDRAITDACQPSGEAPAPLEQVDAKTPPCFLAAARDDMVVPIFNTVDFLTALDKYSITYECHIYPYGNHGFSTGNSEMGGGTCSRIPHWVDDSIQFLWDVFGTLKPEGMTEPKCPARLNANTEPTLSIKCSVGYLRRFAQDVPALPPILAQIDAYSGKLFGKSGEAVANQFCLDVLLASFQLPAEQIAAIDAALRAVPNPIN